MYLQADDGEFYNFITDRNGTINKTGNTSYKSSGWWAARGGMGVSLGLSRAQIEGSAYAGKLRDHFTLLRDVWAREVAATYGKFSPCMASTCPAG